MLLYQWLNEATERKGVGRALLYRDSYLSWRGLLDRVDRRAQELQSLGIEAGDWVGLMLGNVPDLVILLLAVSKLRATAVLLDPTTGVRELQSVLEVFPLRALLTRPRGGTDPGTAPSTLMRARAVSAKEWQAETKGTGVFIEPDLRKRLQGTLITCLLYNRAPVPAPGPLVFVTHDGAGHPKGVCRQDAQLAAHSDLLCAALGLTPQDRIFGLLPLSVAYNFECSLLLSLRMGLPLYLEEEMTPLRVAKLLKEQAITLFPANPWFYASLYRVASALPKMGIPDARFLSSGSMLPGSVAEGFAKRFGIRPRSLYYTVETGAISCDVAEKSQTGLVGTPLAHVEVQLRPVSTKGRGEVWVRSPVVSSDMVLHPDAPRLDVPQMGDMDAEGWMCTGDQGMWDAQGRLVLQGRTDDLVKINHKRVHLHETVACLRSHPRVRSAQARLETDAEMNPILIVSVQKKGPCTESDLLDFCARYLPPYKAPRKIEFI